MMRPPNYAAARRFISPILALMLVLLALTGCDSNGFNDDEATVTAEEAAESIALTVAESSGGTLDDLSTASSLLSGGVGSASAPKTFTREQDCSYTAETSSWSCTLSISGSTDRIASAQFDRSYAVQFFSGDAPVRFPADADSMTLGIASGSGSFVTERVDNSHTLLTSTWALSKDGSGTYRVSLLDGPAGRNVDETATTQRGTRTRDAEARKTSVDNVTLREGEGPVSGTMEGTYAATVTIERDSGNRATRTINVSYVITFSETGAELTFTGGGERFNGQSFTFDVDTGELR